MRTKTSTANPFYDYIQWDLYSDQSETETTPLYYGYHYYELYGHYDLETDFAFDFFKSNFEPLRYLVHATTTAYEIASVINFLVNIPHLLILLQRELRANLVYITMIDICLSDLAHSLGVMSYKAVESQIFSQLNDVILVNRTVFRRCAAFLALFKAAFRAFSVFFPMSSSANFLMKGKSAVLVVLSFSLVCIVWSSYYFVSCKVETVAHIIYVFVTAALVFALCQAKKRRKGLKNDKPNNTSELIVVMAVSLFLSEATYGALFIFTYYFNDFEDQIMLEDFEVVALIFSMINSTTHCIICVFMSSQYRDTIKRMVGWKEKQKMDNVKNLIVVESSAHPSTARTSKTSNDSKKTF
ncbi:Protein CBG01224 [Caenorhabditis briggsae]|uniref:Protein CBG01224 n=1 Tax=Caenorhabditis briggsae TaxID=6238 RepID=A8WPW0_CAEBR|nr:Protein CBG01224 [Caenorhabditis briggsae]CAP22518.2 Protein CBG01224 [Caenorhabditis briggsae]